MKYYIVDTHALVWRLLQSKKLSIKANKAFTEGIEGKTSLIIPAIVLLEVMSVLEKYGMEDRFLEILDDIERTPMYEICSINIEVLRETAKIKDIEELHDRVIVAIARMKNAAIITKDREIRNVYPKTIW
ncbi:MAG: type II toxin-antitoxin system VapC family toxin [Candidatus Cloacimonadota bacterium]|nr:MAG: type II toxin-antitoxin system VapC family toxin [Candidatus Cloacimonadota bacterium]